jgi:hypothetical protein
LPESLTKLAEVIDNARSRGCGPQVLRLQHVGVTPASGEGTLGQGSTFRSTRGRVLIA